MSESKVENEPRPKPQTLWQENHGSFLLGFLALIFLFGAGILIYRQARFHPPRFPDSESIENPDVTSTSLNPGDSAAGDRVSVIISGAANANGAMMVAIYDSAEGFNSPDQAIMRETLRITEGVATWLIPLDALPETMAVTAYHDENGDGEMNRNRIGIPAERYGFSNNARGVTGPPEFSDAVVDRPEVGKAVTVYIR